MKITKDFSFEEFSQSSTATKHGIINQINDFAIRDNLVALVKEVLQPLRDALGRPIKIDSGYRCPELNRLVGGVPTSQHTRGEASDLYTGSSEASYDLAKKIMELKLPYDQLILYPTFVHVSHSRTHNRGQLLYNRRYAGKRF